MTGFINVNKVEGASSAREVSKIKKLAGVPCGHMGTLDPMASGVLPVAVGNASRLFDYFLDKSKTYIATFLFGYDSDTLDTTGNLIKTGEYVPEEREINNILHSFTGEILQLPPKYSAKCVNGVRGYQLARKGIDFELKPKAVKINYIKSLGKVNENSFKFEINCGGGTYIRSLARDIAAKLSTHAVMSGLVRTSSGIFNIENAVQTELLNAENFKNYLIPTQDVLPFDEIHPTQAEAKKLFNGICVESGLSDGTYKIYGYDGCFYGLAEVKNNILKVRTKLC